MGRKWRFWRPGARGVRAGCVEVFASQPLAPGPLGRKNFSNFCFFCASARVEEVKRTDYGLPATDYFTRGRGAGSVLSRKRQHLGETIGWRYAGRGKGDGRKRFIYKRLGACFSARSAEGVLRRVALVLPVIWGGFRLRRGFRLRPSDFAGTSRLSTSSRSATGQVAAMDVMRPAGAVVLLNWAHLILNVHRRGQGIARGVIFTGTRREVTMSSPMIRWRNGFILCAGRSGADEG